MAATVEMLRERWHDVGVELAWSPRAAAALGSELLARYQEPHRHYHGIAHLAAVLEVLDELAGSLAPPVTARLAAWFHDAVYTGAAGTDEEASAQLAEAQLTGIGLPLADATAVANMVRATAHHFDPDATHDPLTALVLDADLAILGTDAATYDRYCDGIRAEYAHIPDDRFRSGRLAVVEALLARPRLYLTAPGVELFEDAAHQNLERERARLRQSAVEGGS